MAAIDPLAVAVIGSALAAVLAYLLNGQSERSLERSKVNYSTKLAAFQTVNSLVEAVQSTYRMMDSLATALFFKDKPTIERQTLVSILTMNMLLSLPDELKSEMARLKEREEALEQMDDSDPSRIVKIAAECWAREIIPIHLCCLQKLKSLHYELILVADTTEVLGAFERYLSALDAGLKTTLSEDLEEKTTRLRKDGWAIHQSQTKLILAMRHELRITMLSRIGKVLANREFRKNKDAAEKRIAGTKDSVVT